MVVYRSVASMNEPSFPWSWTPTIHPFESFKVFQMMPTVTASEFLVHLFSQVIGQLWRDTVHLYASAGLRTSLSSNVGLPGLPPKSAKTNYIRHWLNACPVWWFQPISKKNRSNGSSNPKFQGEKNEPKNVWKNSWWKGSPHLAKKHHETTFQAFWPFLGFAYFVLGKRYKQNSGGFSWWWIFMVESVENPMKNKSNICNFDEIWGSPTPLFSFKVQTERTPFCLVMSCCRRPRPRTGAGVFFFGAWKGEMCFFLTQLEWGGRGQQKLTFGRVVFAFVWKQGFQKWICKSALLLCNDGGRACKLSMMHSC